MYLEKNKLKEFILDSGLVTRAEYDKAEADSRKDKTLESAEKLLVSAGKITEDDLRRANAYVFGIPFVDLKMQRIDFSI